MNASSFHKTIETQPASEETQVLIQSGFSLQEMVALVRLRERYEHGGSDRGDVVRHLEFLKFLLRTGKLRE